MRTVNTTEAVSVRALCKDFANGGSVAHVLRDVALDVPAGEITMLVGPSGCGKTTLISAIAGILTPTSGEVEVFGTRLFELSDRDRVAFRRANIGFIFQQYNLLPALSAAENAAVPLVAAGVSHRKARHAALALLEALGMGPHASKKPTELSGGQQQRVAIARALVHEPRLIVCDEPTAALDAESGHAVLGLLRQFAVRPGRAVIVVTHDNRIFSFADRIAHMDDGRIVDIETKPPPAVAA